MAENDIDKDTFLAIRLHIGLTQKQLAKKLRVSERSVVRWENGKNKIPFLVSWIMQVLYANHENNLSMGRMQRNGS